MHAMEGPREPSHILNQRPKAERRVGVPPLNKRAELRATAIATSAQRASALRLGVGKAHGKGRGT